MAAKKEPQDKKIEVVEIGTETITMFVVGKTPLIMNKLSNKSGRDEDDGGSSPLGDLLFPPKKKSTIEKETTLKHDPIAEFRRSAHTMPNADANTLLAMPSTAFKGALRSTATDMPGGNKSALGRLTYIEGEFVEIYGGSPKMLMSAVRQAGQNRTPDVRTRLILPEWCATFSLTYTVPNLTDKTIVTLMAAAGLIRGIGDWRPEKGNGNYGQFRLVAQDDPDYQRIKAAGGRKAQIKAMENVEYYDQFTQEMFEWFAVEAANREFEITR